jgi:nitrogenase molybdenum-iron protein beta chain
MMKVYFRATQSRESEKVLDEERINIIPGFEPYFGSLAEIKEMS